MKTLAWTSKQTYLSPRAYAARDLIEAIRIKQWIKNLVVPIVAFAMLGPEILTSAPMAAIAFSFLSFCAASSSIYLLNDLIDIPKDRAHPKKRHRPLASGRICPSFACGLLAVSFPLAFFLAGFAGADMVLLLALYVLINTGYCLGLKNVPQIDIVCVASGFTLRALAGAAAAGRSIDFWLLAAITFACVGMAVMKRMKELKALGDSGSTRSVLASYHYETLLRAHDVFMILSVQAVVIFIERSAQKFSNHFTAAAFLIYVSTLFLIFMHRVHDEKDGDPTSLIYRNKCSAAFAILVFFALFLLE